MKAYPRWFLPALVAALVLVFASGCLLAPTTLEMRLELEVPWRLPASGRVLVAALHALGSLVLMLWIGALWSVHMRAGWRRRERRASGLIVGGMLLLLGLSSIAVYYAGEEAAGVFAALTHLGLGLALTGPFGWHWVRGRRTRRQAQGPVAKRA